MAWAEVARAKANATAMNLIIVFPCLPRRGERTPNRDARLDALARLARAAGGKDRRGQTTSSARRGDYRDGCDRSYELMGSPTKNWSKLLTRATNNLLTSAGPGKPPRHNLVDHRCEAALTPMLFQMGRCPLGNSLSGRARHRTAHSASPFRPGNRREGLGGSPATIRTEVPCELENDEALEAARRPFDPRIMPLPGSFRIHHRTSGET